MPHTRTIAALALRFNNEEYAAVVAQATPLCAQGVAEALLLRAKANLLLDNAQEAVFDLHQLIGPGTTANLALLQLAIHAATKAKNLPLALVWCEQGFVRSKGRRFGEALVRIREKLQCSHEAATLVPVVNATPDDHTLRIRLVEILADSECWSALETHLDPLLPFNGPFRSRFQLHKARARWANGDADAARDWAWRACGEGTPDAPFPPAKGPLPPLAPTTAADVLAWFVQIGAFTDATTLALQLWEGGNLDATHTLAQMALWANRFDEAEQWCQTAEAQDSTLDWPPRVRAAIDLANGHPARAIATLSGQAKHPTAHILIAEARDQQGDPSDIRALSAQLGQASTPIWKAEVLSAWAYCRDQAAVRSRQPTSMPIPDHIDLMVEYHAKVLQKPLSLSACLALSPKDWLRHFADFEERLGTNTSSTPTEADPAAPAGIRRLHLQTTRVSLLKERSKFRALSLADTFAALDQAIRDYPHSALAWTYRGELALWAGDYAEGQRCCTRALEMADNTRWAWVGLAAAHLFQQRPKQALDILDKARSTFGSVPPTAFVYIGEAYRLLGDPTRAQENLEHARSLHPSRLSAWVNLGLLYNQQQNTHAWLEVVQHIRQSAWPVVRDALAGPATFPHARPPTRLDPITPNVLEEMLRLMRGNRSSGQVTWMAEEGKLRALRWAQG